MIYIYNSVAPHLFWPQINLIDCHRITRYNDIKIKKEKVPEHLLIAKTSTPRQAGDGKSEYI